MKLTYLVRIQIFLGILSIMVASWYNIQNTNNVFASEGSQSVGPAVNSPLTTRGSEDSQLAGPDDSQLPNLVVPIPYKLEKTVREGNDVMVPPKERKSAFATCHNDETISGGADDQPGNRRFSRNVLCVDRRWVRPALFRTHRGSQVAVRRSQKSGQPLR